jgi:hypothetical protein
MTVVPGWLIPDGYHQEYPSLTVSGTFLDGSARQEKKLAGVRHLAFVARQTASFVRSVLGETSDIIWSSDDRNDGMLLVQY